MWHRISRVIFIYLCQDLSPLKKTRTSLLSTWPGLAIANIMLHCKFYYYYIEFECVFLLCLEWDVMY